MATKKQNQFGMLEKKRYSQSFLSYAGLIGFPRFLGSGLRIRRSQQVEVAKEIFRNRHAGTTIVELTTVLESH